MKRIIALLSIFIICFSLFSCNSSSSSSSSPYIQDGYWYVDGANTGIKAEGADGKDGSNGADGNTPYVQDGYWYISGVNTGTKAEGVDGMDGKDAIAPTIEIDENGYWVINGVSTNVKAVGIDGKDGKDGDSAPILVSTNDKTDRTADILNMLNTYGVCTLGNGEFYVSNLDMPANTTLQGGGNNSVLRLDLDVIDGYAVQIGAACTIQDIAIDGGLASRPSKIGTRHGIVLQGDASGADSFDVRWWPTVTNCYIVGFSGGGITCHDTGYGLRHGLNVTNCKIYACGAGINIDYFSEYHRFTNVATYNCMYGCLNNGGNNMFVNCMFSGSTIGFYINGNGMPNDSHGSAIGCTFNHNGSNAGPAIKIVGADYGYIFQGCQVFFGSIDIEDSEGIVFDGMNMDSNQIINVTGGDLVLFSDSAFSNMPTFNITNNENVNVHDCYTWSGEAVTIH